MTSTTAVLLDLDGTLVDSVYHHVLAWQASLRDAGYDVPAARIHAGIGMGSDRLVPWLLGRHVDDADALAEEHTRRFVELGDRLRPTPGAAALLDDLQRREVPFVVATSAGSEEREVLLAVLGDPDLPLAGAGDELDSKPSPDTVLAACGQLGTTPERAILVGDAPWDARAARRVGARAVGVRCGGFGDAVLLAAGAERVAEDPRELVGQL